MKKLLSTLLSLMLVLAVAFSFAACSDDKKEEPKKNDIVEPSGDEPEVDEPEVDEPEVDEQTEVEKYVEQFGDELANAIVGSSGVDGDYDVYAEGNEIIVEFCMAGVDNTTAEQKAAVQEAYDSLGDSLKDALAPAKEEIPSLEALVILFCEEDGDLIAECKVELD